MNILSTRIHGILDYIAALLMLTTPWLMGFDENSSERWIMIGIGSVTLIYSLCTDYEFGFLEEIEVRTHLLLDFLIGVILVASPWLFGFYDNVYLPYVALGMVEILSTFVTKANEKGIQKKQRHAIRNNA